MVSRVALDEQTSGLAAPFVSLARGPYSLAATHGETDWQELVVAPFHQSFPLHQTLGLVYHQEVHRNLYLFHCTDYQHINCC